MATALGATMRGKMVPPDIYDLALKERDAFRARAKAAPAAAQPQPKAPAPGQ